MMTYNFTASDEVMMKVALEEAKAALKGGNFPIGAVLVVNGKIVAQARNQLRSKRDRISHAEMIVFMNYSSEIYQWSMCEQTKVELFTTYEPCLMCLGTAVLHRIDRIVVGCKDPRGDMTSIKPELMGTFYATHWPSLEYGLLSEESFKLLYTFHSNRTDPEGKEVAKLFAQIAKLKGIS